MDFRKWLVSEEQHSNDALFMQTTKRYAPNNSDLKFKKPSDGVLPPGKQPALFMKKKMKKESVFHEELAFDPHEKVAKELVYLLDSRPFARGENHDRTWVEREALKLITRFFPNRDINWSRLEELAKNFADHVYNNYPEDFIKTQETKLDALLAYLPRYFSGQ